MSVQKNGTGFILTADALLALASAAVLLGVLSTLADSQPALPLEDNFAHDLLSVYSRAALSKDELSYMFDSAGKCGGIYRMGESAGGAADTIFEKCACPEGKQKRTYYGVVALGGEPALLKAESCAGG